MLTHFRTVAGWLRQRFTPVMSPDAAIKVGAKSFCPRLQTPWYFGPSPKTRGEKSLSMYSSTLRSLSGNTFWSAARFLAASCCAALALLCSPQLTAATPTVGDSAPDFTLNTLTGHSVKLSTLPPTEHTVLVLLRGWPGYQCPFCTTQVYEYMGHAADFLAKNVQVILIYPGPSEELQAHAQEFLQDKPLPENIIFLLDPNYEFTNGYSLRWNGKGETAYPSTFVLDRDRIVRFAHVSREHGDRISAAAVLRFLDQSMLTSSGK